MQTGDERVLTASLDERGRAATPQLLPTNERVFRRVPQWSPDGNTLAHVVVRGINNIHDADTFIRFVDSRTEQRRDVVPGMRYFGGSTFKWSPDARQLLMRGKGLNGLWGLYRMDVATGETAPVALPTQRAGEEFGPAYSWSRDGQSVYFTRIADGGLYERNLKSGAERAVLVPTPRAFIPAMAMSPDGRLALPLIRSAESSATLNVIDPDGTMREVRRLTGNVLILPSGWTPDGRLLHTVGAPGAKRRLWSVRMNNRESIDSGLEIQSNWPVSVHPDGRAVAFSEGKPGFEIWMMKGIAR